MDIFKDWENLKTGLFSKKDVFSVDSIEGCYFKLVERNSETRGNIVNDDLLSLDHHVIKASGCLFIGKLNSKELHFCK